MKTLLKISLFEAFLFSLMVGVGETYFPAFALRKGMSETLSGFVATLPLLVGAFIQLATPTLLRRGISPKKWAYSVALSQALLFLVFLYFAFQSQVSPVPFFAACALYFACTFSAGSAWNLWMTDLVSEDLSSHFFSLRLRISQLGIFVGLIFGGVSLHLTEKGSNIFAILFAVALVARVGSALYLKRTPDTPLQHNPRHIWSVTEIVSRFFRSRRQISFFGFLFLFYTIIYVSSPFVTPFFLKKLELSYFNYMLGLASLLFFKALAMPLAKSWIHRYGLPRVFFIGALGLSPLPALWALDTSLPFIIFLQGLSGAFWGIFEVALSVMFFNHLCKEEKVSTLSVYNFFNALALFLGTFIGGVWLHNRHESLEGYFDIFIVGAFLRVAAVVVFYGIVRKQSHLLDEREETETADNVSGPLSRGVRV